MLVLLQMYSAIPKRVDSGFEFFMARSKVFNYIG